VIDLHKALGPRFGELKFNALTSMLKRVMRWRFWGSFRAFVIRISLALDVAIPVGLDAAEAGSDKPALPSLTESIS
jgi:hypothetical protein